MIWKISGALFALFTLYRSYFWEGFWENWINIILLAFFDTAVCVSAIAAMYYLVEKRLNLNHRPALFGLSWLVALVVSSLVLWALHYLGYTLSGSMDGSFRDTFKSMGFQVFDVFTLVMVGVSAGYSLMKYRDASESEKRVGLLEQQREKAELSFLKSQMNPHFIFNSLNTIYFSIDKGHPAREIVSTFSDLLRFQLYECSHDYISLKQEIAFLRQYLLLHEIRMSESMAMKVQLPTDIPNYRIAPLLIIPFIENALKHASSGKGQKRQVEIRVEITNDHLWFSACNSLDIHDKKSPNIKGIGVKNARRRMDLLFGKNYSFDNRKTHEGYEVQLKIPLQ